MELILVGYGKMNRLVESLAREQGHAIAQVIRRPEDWVQGWRPSLVAIDFSVPDAVLPNLERAMLAGIPMVIGTTGWYSELQRAQQLVARSSVGVLYGPNFSVGVNAFLQVIRSAAASIPAQYDTFIWEAHHRQKKDAPSGTAGKLHALLTAAGHMPGSIASTRAGTIPGTHVVGFDSEADTITLTHTARSRRGFAEGALLGARWLLGRTGFYEFSAVFEAITAFSGGAPMGGANEKSGV